MTQNVITVGASKYGVGLFWQPSPDTNVRAAARKAAKQPGYQSDLFVVRPATRARPMSQYGLGLSAYGHKAGMAAAAGCLANAMPGSYAGAFRVPEGIWFAVIRDDLVDADGDVLFISEQEAQLRLEQEMARGGLSKIYAPAEWSVDGAEDTALSSLLVGRKDVVFEDIKGTQKILMLLGGLVLLMGLGYGGYTYYMQMEQEKADELARQQAESQRLAKQLADKQYSVNVGKVDYPKTWQTSPAARQWLLACDAAMGKVPANVLGWRLSSLSCTGKSLSLAWTHGTGLATLPPTGAKWDAVLKASTMNIPLENVPARGEETLWTRRQMDEFILGTSMTISVADLPNDSLPTPPPPPKGSNVPAPPPPPPPEWQKRSFKFSTNYAPWLLGGVIDLPGLIITSIKQSGENWSVDALIYEMKDKDNTDSKSASATATPGPVVSNPAVGNAAAANDIANGNQAGKDNELPFTPAKPAEISSTPSVTPPSSNNSPAPAPAVPTNSSGATNAP